MSFRTLATRIALLAAAFSVQPDFPTTERVALAYHQRGTLEAEMILHSLYTPQGSQTNPDVVAIQRIIYSRDATGNMRDSVTISDACTYSMKDYFPADTATPHDYRRVILRRDSIIAEKDVLGKGIQDSTKFYTAQAICQELLDAADELLQQRATKDGRYSLDFGIEGEILIGRWSNRDVNRPGPITLMSVYRPF